MSYGPYSTAPGPTTITITPVNPVNQPAASYSGSLSLTPASYTTVGGSIPSYGGTVTLTPNFTGSTTASGWTATIYGPIQVIGQPRTDEEIILLLVGQILQGSGPSSGRTEETRKRMAESAVLDAWAILAALRKIKKVTDVLSQGDTQGEEAAAQSQP